MNILLCFLLYCLHFLVSDKIGRQRLSAVKSFRIVDSGNAVFTLHKEYIKHYKFIAELLINLLKPTGLRDAPPV
jgi:hypothetical protein